MNRLSSFGKKPLCNYRKHTAPHVGGFCLPVCWRCFGVLIGSFCLFFLEKVFYRFPITHYGWGLLMLIPIALDGYLQYFVKKESTNIRRFATGYIASIGARILLNYVKM